MDMQKEQATKVCSKKSENGEQEQNYTEFDRYMHECRIRIHRVCKKPKTEAMEVIEKARKPHG